jgi:hypothetical protein
VLGRVPAGGHPEEVVENGIAIPHFAISQRTPYLFRADRSVYALSLKGGPARKLDSVPPLTKQGANA